MSGVDIVVSFDTTGSMYPALAEVRRKVSEFIDALFDNVDDLRIGILTHGDYIDNDKLITAIPLSNNRQGIIQFVRIAPSTSGGDSDEAYEYILKVVREQYQWREDAQKILILIADADPHPVGYYYENGPRLIGGKLQSRNELNWYDEAQKLVKYGVMIYPVQALNHAGTTFYKKLAELSNTPKLDLHQFSNIIPILTAIIYKQQSNTQVEQYSEQLAADGQLNRNIAQVIDLLLGKEIASIEFNKSITRFSGDVSDLREVDPTRFQMLHVDHTQDIKSFVLSTGAIFKVGRGFYELTKPETIQERKEVVLRDKKTGDMWSGEQAREMIGFPYGVRGTVKPDYSFPYDVFIQSTSANRKLIGGTRFLYEAK